MVSPTGLLRKYTHLTVLHADHEVLSGVQILRLFLVITQVFLSVCPGCELKVIDQISSELSGHCALSRLNWPCAVGSAPFWMKWRNSRSGLFLKIAFCSRPVELLVALGSLLQHQRNKTVDVWFSGELKYTLILLYW